MKPRIGPGKYFHKNKPRETRFNPIVLRLFDELAARKINDAAACRLAGFAHTTINHWRHCRNPSLPNIQAALNVVGLDLAVVPRRHD